MNGFLLIEQKIARYTSQEPFSLVLSVSRADSRAQHRSWVGSWAMVCRGGGGFEQAPDVRGIFVARYSGWGLNGNEHSSN